MLTDSCIGEYTITSKFITKENLDTYKFCDDKDECKNVTDISQLEQICKAQDMKLNNKIDNSGYSIDYYNCIGKQNNTTGCFIDERMYCDEKDMCKCLPNDEMAKMTTKCFTDNNVIRSKPNKNGWLKCYKKEEAPPSIPENVYKIINYCTDENNCKQVLPSYAKQECKNKKLVNENDKYYCKDTNIPSDQVFNVIHQFMGSDSNKNINITTKDFPEYINKCKNENKVFDIDYRGNASCYTIDSLTGSTYNERMYCDEKDNCNYIKNIEAPTVFKKCTEKKDNHIGSLPGLLGWMSCDNIMKYKFPPSDNTNKYYCDENECTVVSDITNLKDKCTSKNMKLYLDSNNRYYCIGKQNNNTGCYKDERMYCDNNNCKCMAFDELKNVIKTCVIDTTKQLQSTDGKLTCVNREVSLDNINKTYTDLVQKNIITKFTSPILAPKPQPISQPISQPKQSIEQDIKRAKDFEIEHESSNHTGLIIGISVGVIVLIAIIIGIIYYYKN